MSLILNKLVLSAAGLIALAIGATITLAPEAFYQSYGIALPQSTDMLSELRAPGMNLAVFGSLILMTALRGGMTRTAALLGSLLFLAYAAGRLIGIFMDGVPSNAILQALAIEIAIGGICAAIFRKTKAPVSTSQSEPALP